MFQLKLSIKMIIRFCYNSSSLVVVERNVASLEHLAVLLLLAQLDARLRRRRRFLLILVLE